MSAVPHRSIKSVTAHVRRDYHPLAKLGDWDVNEDEELKAWVLALTCLLRMFDTVYASVPCARLGLSGPKLARRLAVQLRIVGIDIETTSAIKNSVLVVSFVLNQQETSD